MSEPEDHPLYQDYIEDWGFEIADLQNDTPEYRARYYRNVGYKPFPTFDEWLTARVVSDVEDAIWTAKYQAVFPPGQSKAATR